ncbi:MAG: hypothetical protein ACOC5T_06155 [Elusimicrobiota bacterium]
MNELEKELVEAASNATSALEELNYAKEKGTNDLSAVEEFVSMAEDNIENVTAILEDMQKVKRWKI